MSLHRHDGQIRRRDFVGQADGHRDGPGAAGGGVEPEALPAQEGHPVGPVIHQPYVFPSLKQQGPQQTAQGSGSDYGNFHGFTNEK